MNKNKGFRGLGLGVGYVSVMIIFAAVCLTLFAVLSFRAAKSNDAFNERSGDFLKQYYEADSKAKEILAQLDECANSAVNSGFFADSFEFSAGEIEGVRVTPAMGGIRAEYSVQINETRELAVRVTFKESGGYDIGLWQSKATAENGDDSHINVWDGNIP